MIDPFQDTIRGANVTIPGTIRAGTALAAAALVVACSAAPQGSAPVPATPGAPATTAPPATPEVLVAGASATTRAAGTARFWATTVLMGPQPDTIVMHGLVDFGRQLAQGELTTSDGTFQFVSDATTAYTQPYGAAAWLAVPNTGPDGASPARQFDLLTQPLTELRELDRTDVRGTPVRHLAMRVALPAQAPEAALPDLGPQPLELFVDDRGRVNRMQVTITAAGETLTTSSDFYEFGVPVAVRLPDPQFVVSAPPEPPPG
jgi:hypothetical protein